MTAKQFRCLEEIDGQRIVHDASCACAIRVLAEGKP